MNRAADSSHYPGISNSSKAAFVAAYQGARVVARLCSAFCLPPRHGPSLGHVVACPDVVGPTGEALPKRRSVNTQHT